MRTRAVLLAAVTSLSLFSLAACGGGDEKKSEDSAAGKPVGAKKVAVKVADTELGKILVDQAGRTLYGFTKDKEGVSACSESCIAVWPALTAEGKPTAGDGTESDLFNMVKRAEGAQQVAYKEWPLYYYAGDAVPGDLNGQGLDEEWFAVAPDGSLVKSPAS
ncbi:hypothetical protein ACIPPJ_24545 [Streptomyces sp. NPDC086091]|uniref:COG4315 family predicted lipoprotein n=1 Tax=Streptomyces sp. NPDC086091 TaxID=3365751 RepID=UPI00382B2BE6